MIQIWEFLFFFITKVHVYKFIWKSNGILPIIYGTDQVLYISLI